MDRTHFGLRHRPFRTTPDTECYYPATTHELALAELRGALEDDEGIALLTAAPGMGKTLLLHRLLESIPDTSRAVFLTNTHWTARRDLLQAILFDLSLPYEDRSEQESRLAVTEACLAQFQSGGKTIVVIDEAHHLSTDHLEELRLLTNLEGRSGKAVQAVISGLPALRHKLAEPALMHVSQRVRVRAGLDPLSIDESADYLLQQLRLAGGRPERILSEEAIELIVKAARGVPRLLNQLALASMHLAASAGSKQVDAEAAIEAMAQLGLEVEDALAEPEPGGQLEPSDPAISSGMAEPRKPSALDAPPALDAPADRPPVLIFDGAEPDTTSMQDAESLASRLLARSGLPTRAG